MNKPCPFCHNQSTHDFQWVGSKEIIDMVQCLICKAEAPKSVWNGDRSKNEDKLG